MSHTRGWIRPYVSRTWTTRVSFLFAGFKILFSGRDIYTYIIIYRRKGVVWLVPCLIWWFGPGQMNYRENFLLGFPIFRCHVSFEGGLAPNLLEPNSHRNVDFCRGYHGAFSRWDALRKSEVGNRKRETCRETGERTMGIVGGSWLLARS